jgi:hypothetical protein
MNPVYRILVWGAGGQSTTSGDYPAPAVHFNLPLKHSGVRMAKIKISNADLVWVFAERLRPFSEYDHVPSVAIVPAEKGWMVVTNARLRNSHPLLAKRIDQIQKQLRKVYALAND